MENVMTDIKGKRHQVANQCRVIVHLALSIAKLYADTGQMASEGFSDRILDLQGGTTHWLMNALGDALNNVDAADDADKWMDSIFEKAREMFPRPDDADA